jgi:predicted TIM-barrel fold metal-dependent hydrolase
MKALCDEIDNQYPPVSDGTAAGLLSCMDEWGVDVSVLLPVITSERQFKKANDFSASLQSERFCCFGGIYPHTSDYKRDIDYVVSLGLKGLKFHAEYQDFVIDEPRMLPVYDYALSRGLILVHHAGFDPAFKPPWKSSPRQFARLARELRGGVIVAAHLGGHAQWEEVEEHLAGTDIYLDTSMGFEYYPRERFLSIVNKHGADKVLFASDAPWSNAGAELAHLRGLPLPPESISAIAGGNAERLLYGGA